MCARRYSNFCCVSPKVFGCHQLFTGTRKMIAFYRLQGKPFVCIGDFNEDATSGGPIQCFMKKQGCKQIVDFKTTEGANTLDHVYLSKSLIAKVEKISTYYSYHDALILTIKYGSWISAKYRFRISDKCTPIFYPLQNNAFPIIGE